MLCTVIIATLQVSFLSYVFCVPDIMAEKKKQETLFSTAEKMSGRIKAMSRILSARLQTRDHDIISSVGVAA